MRSDMKGSPFIPRRYDTDLKNTLNTGDGGYLVFDTCYIPISSEILKQLIAYQAFSDIAASHGKPVLYIFESDVLYITDRIFIIELLSIIDEMYDRYELNDLTETFSWLKTGAAIPPDFLNIFDDFTKLLAQLRLYDWGVPVQQIKALGIMGSYSEILEDIEKLCRVYLDFPEKDLAESFPFLSDAMRREVFERLETYTARFLDDELEVYEKNAFVRNYHVICYCAVSILKTAPIDIKLVLQPILELPIKTSTLVMNVAALLKKLYLISCCDELYQVLIPVLTHKSSFLSSIELSELLYVTSQLKNPAKIYYKQLESLYRERFTKKYFGEDVSFAKMVGDCTGRDELLGAALKGNNKNLRNTHDIYTFVGEYQDVLLADKNLENCVISILWSSFPYWEDPGVFDVNDEELLEILKYAVKHGHKDLIDPIMHILVLDMIESDREIYQQAKIFLKSEGFSNPLLMVKLQFLIVKAVIKKWVRRDGGGDFYLIKKIDRKC